MHRLISSSAISRAWMMSSIRSWVSRVRSWAIKGHNTRLAIASFLSRAYGAPNGELP